MEVCHWSSTLCNVYSTRSYYRNLNLVVGIMTTTELLAKARSQIGLKTKYRLGGGHVAGDTCRDDLDSCDCSSFVLWCLGLSRRHPEFSWLRVATNGWLNTDGIWYDVMKGPHDLFVPTEHGDGAIIVYPATWMSKVVGPSIGHIGILTAPDRVIQCSSGNYKSTGDAIGETGIDIFTKRGAITVWAKHIIRG